MNNSATSEQGLMTRRISNSEVSSWLVCQLQYRFAYDLKLEKIPTGKSAKGTGIAAHEGFQAYNRARVAGADHQEAMRAADLHLMTLINKGESHQDDIFQAKILTSIYHQHYGDELSNYEIINAEQTVDLPMNEEFTMPLRYDWYGIHKPTGKYVLKDYKTTYDFWTSDRMALSPQFAKYFVAFRNAGMRIDECQLDQIRTRWKKVGEHTFDELFKRVDLVPSKAKMRSVLKQHILASQRITEYRELPPEVREQVALPCLNWMVCGMCDYKSICRATIDGADSVNLNLIASTEYRKNTYDYNTDEVPDLRELL